MSKKLYVGNLSYNTTESELMNEFSQFGSVDSINIIVDRETGRCKGFGFIEMSSPEEASTCILKLDTKEFMGRALRVNVATTQKEKPAFRNRY